MKKTVVFVLIVFGLAVMNVASADNRLGIEFVPIGNPGNAADPLTICGAVGYNYRIGKYEVTNAQWNAFTAAAGAPTGNPSNAYDESAYFPGAQQPTNKVSWLEAAQFCNYLTSGNKLIGAYHLDPIQLDGRVTIDRAAAISAYGKAYVIPTEDEWYKAAYFKPNGSGYSVYANGTSTPPIAGEDSIYRTDWPLYYTPVQPWNVGTGTQEQNGTFDMMGNVLEWNETDWGFPRRGLRGGSYYNYDHLDSASQGADYSTNESITVGFRIAEIVPEPATMCLLGLGGLALLRKRRA